MELRQLAAFRAVATLGSVTRAAATLNYVQSSVTAQLQALEADLGVPLFDRLGRRLVLNEAGRRLLPYAEQILGLVTAAQGALVVAVNEPSGVLTISAPETICTYRLPQLLQACRERYPGIQLAFRPLPSEELRRAVRTGSIDAAFTLDEPSRLSGDGVDLLVAEPLVVIAAHDHPLADRQAVAPADLKAEVVLLTEAGCTYRNLFLCVLADAGVYPSTVLEFGSVEAIKQCVRAGMGLSFLPLVAVTDELATGQLVRLAWVGPMFEMATQLLYHPARAAAPVLRAFRVLAHDLLGTDC